MGWFDEQIRQRIQGDQDSFADAFADMSSVIMGKSALLAALNDDRKKTKEAIDEILKYYHIKPAEAPDTIKDMNEQIEYVLRPWGIMRRIVKLEGEWYKDGIGPLLAQTKSGDTVALIPSGLSGYDYFDYQTGQRIRITKKNANQIEEEALCFYKPFPLRPITVKDLILYIFQTLSTADFVMIALATLVATLLGLLSPFINSLVFNKLVPSGAQSLIIPVACLMVGATVATSLINITKSLVINRLKTKMSVAVQSAAMMRVFSLPVDFFKKFSAGELSSRTQSINRLCTMLLETALTTGLSSLFSLTYITQIVAYAPALVVPALVIIFSMILVSVLSMLWQMKISRRKMELGAKQSGEVFALFSGVQKIKLAGAEKRAFAKWARGYKQVAELEYNPPLFLRLNGPINAAIALIGTIVLYFSAATSGVSAADYMAFNVSYGMVSAAFMSVAGIALTLANIKPVLEMAEPIFKATPEVSGDKPVVTRLSGNIELNNVSFRYTPDMPMVLDNLSLKIRAGQYVAIVGSTGCGKSTLMRLLLGFERPLKGAVYYDGKDVASIDMRTFRQAIGVVLQNGKLFSGDIYSNIAISAPKLTVDEAWEVAELAGIAEDIRHMPMGMHTLISEGGGGISGGQRQRLLIARAIAPKPKILMFDEATSALDNITQKRVSDALGKLKCTRIVIAHRLSTIKQCDRIIVLDKGHIIEDGNYDTLIKKDGFFAELVRRQQLDDAK